MTSPEGVPTEMRSLVAPKFTVPSGFALITLPTPTIFSPTDALIHVHAASINPIDVKKALGISRFMESFTFPHKLGLDASGTVVQVGDEVTDIAVGDDVYFMLTGVTGGPPHRPLHQTPY